MSPIALMRRFADDIDRAVSGLGGQRVDGFAEDFSWMPAVEVRRSGNNLIIHADLPGLSEKDVKVEATGEGLLIEGERNQEHSSEERGVHLSERAYGRFSRLILLPEGAKVDEANASFKNGVLEINIPVPECETKRRQIAIGSSGQVQARAAAAERLKPSLNENYSAKRGRGVPAPSHLLSHWTFKINQEGHLVVLVEFLRAL